MNEALPRFLLNTDAQDDGVWHFRLADVQDRVQLEVSDSEPGVSCQRLEVLALVRGLEALEQPSWVTLSTASRYVLGGLSYGLAEWRDNDWCWESYGELTPIKHCDLWQRVDHALGYHRIECRPIQAERRWRVDAAHRSAKAPHGLMAGAEPRREMAAAMSVRSPERSVRNSHKNSRPAARQGIGDWLVRAAASLAAPLQAKLAH